MANLDIFGNDSASYPRIKGGMRFTGAAIMAFQAPSAKAGASFDGSKWTTDDKNGAAYEGMVVQNYQITYAQTITKLRGLNTTAVLTVVAPPTGQCVLQCAVTGKDTYFQFIEKYGDACWTKENMLHLAGMAECVPNRYNRGIATDGSDTEAWAANKLGGLPSLTLKGCLIAQLQLSQSVENLVLASNLQMEFVALDKNNDGIADGTPFNTGANATPSYDNPNDTRAAGQSMAGMPNMGNVYG